MFSSQDQYLPNLMSFKVQPYPGPILSIKNSLFSKLIITPYYDQDFSKENFLLGAREAVKFVSTCLLHSDFDSLRESEALTTDCFRDVYLNASKFSDFQRQHFQKVIDELDFDFIYQIGVMMDDVDPNSRRVEITYSAHCNTLKVNNVLEDKTFEEMEWGPIFLSYRFYRDYTKGKVEDSWTINALNHMTLRDHINGNQ